ncbi:MAG: SusC/RagA family TonB-linked outer membrane protein [Tannerellaceae bacterium]|nr:SusC/RagA family TonB-linked outer membrane protein [Tannerellaceae bacterium]
MNHVSAQDMTVSLDMTARPAYEVLEAIEKQTPFSFVYDANVVDVGFTVSLHVSGKHLFDLLNSLFETADIAYTVINDKIILNRKASTGLLGGGVKRVDGTVTDQAGEPVAGANIRIKGTAEGTVTARDGTFRLTLPPDAVLVVSFLGYQTEEAAYRGEAALHITLAEDTHHLEEVVVTALGIRKREASLPYTTQTIEGVELTRSKDANLMNTLAGKAAGIQINRNSSGLGGSARTLIRGGRSVSSDNQPLYVIDGLPMLNESNEQAFTIIGGVANAGNRDGGDGISNLNPDDIESLHILKGAAAAALYGWQAANGVILITTKGGLRGKREVRFSSDLTIDQATLLPAFQNGFGRSDDSTGSWGDAAGMPAYDHAGEFFRTGVRAVQSLTVSTGNERLQNYFSYANTSARGIVGQHRLSRHNLTFHQTASLVDNRLTLDGRVSLVMQSTPDRPTSGGFYMNPLPGLYTFPRGTDLSPYKQAFEVFDAERNMPVQNWYTPITDYDQNPYWLANRTQSADKRRRTMTSLAAHGRITRWLTVDGKGSVDDVHDAFRQKIYASTSPGIAGMNGRYIDYTYRQTLLYGDLMATATVEGEAFRFTATAGGSIWDDRTDLLRLDSQTASLYYPNVFTVANIVMSTSAYIDEAIDRRRQVQSFFATAQLGYGERLYVDITARNDWSSTLAFTKSVDRGFFYPSAGVAWVVHKTLRLPGWVSYGKLRGSFSKVGNGLPVGDSNFLAHIGAGGAFLPKDRAPYAGLKPEMTTSFEAGTEWKFFNHRLSIDVTLYQTNTRNQLFLLPSSAGAAYKYYFVNAGDIRNRGLEVMLGANPVLTKGFTWKTFANLSLNRNRVMALHPDLPAFVYGQEGFSSSYTMRLVKGGSFGDIYGKAFDRDDEGKIRYGNDGMPLTRGEGNTVKVGNSAPRFLLGWSHALACRRFSLYFLLDGHFGGEVLSQTEAMLDQAGVSRRTGEARMKGYVDLEGERITDVKGFFEQVGGRNGVTEYYMYDATNIRLRELSLGYAFPAEWTKGVRFVKELQLSVTARNLFFLYNGAPYDPDAVLSTGNDNQGVDVFGMPATRSIGLKVNLVL